MEAGAEEASKEAAAEAATAKEAAAAEEAAAADGEDAASPWSSLPEELLTKHLLPRLGLLLLCRTLTVSRSSRQLAQHSSLWTSLDLRKPSTRALLSGTDTELHHWLAPILSRSGGLRTLRLTAVQNESSCGVVLALVLPVSSELQSLSIRGMAETDEPSGLPALTNLSMTCPQLTELCLTRLSVGNIDQIMESISRCERLITLDISRSQGITDDALRAVANHCSSLQTVDLSHCSALTDDALLALSVCTSIHSLSIQGCAHVTSAGVLEFARGRHMRLFQCGAPWNSVTADALGAITASGHLHTLQITGLQLTDSQIAHAISSSPGLRSLVLTGCKAVGGASLNAIASCPQLTHLDLSDCHQISDHTFQDLHSQILCTNVEKFVILKSPNISDKGLRSMLDLMPKMTSFTVGICRTSLRGALRVGDGVCTKLGAVCYTRLEILSFERCTITDKGLDALVSCSRLTNFTAISCGCFTDTGLEVLMKSCNRLCNLVIRDCARVDGSFVRVAQVMRPQCACKVSAPRRARLEKAAMQSAVEEGLMHVAPVILAPPKMPNHA